MREELIRFFQTQLDYLCLVYGFCFVLLAVVCFFLSKRDLPQWRWLGLFGLFHALDDYMALTQVCLGPQEGWPSVQAAFFVLSFLFLAEFGRAVLCRSFGWMRRWILLLPVTVLAWAVIAGATPADIVGLVRIVLGIPAFACLAGALWLLANSRPAHVLRLRAFAVIIFLYGLSGVLVVPHSGGAAAGLLDEAGFESLFGVPIVLVRVIICLMLVMAVWIYYIGGRHLRDTPLDRSMRRSYFLLGYLLVLIFGFGWELVGRVDAAMDAHLRDEFLSRVRIAALNFDPAAIVRLRGRLEDVELAVYADVRRGLDKVLDLSRDCYYVYLMGYRDGSVFYLADQGEDPELPGEIYPEATDELVECFDTAVPFVEGPVSDEWGVWVSGMVPIVSPDTGKVIAVLGMDIDYARWRGYLARVRFFPMATVVLFAVLLVFYYIFMLSQKESLAAAGSMKQRFEDIAGVTADWLWEIDVGGVHSFSSERVSDILGYAAEDIVGRTLLDFMDEEDAAVSRRRLAGLAAAGGTFQDIELRCRHRDGSRVFLIASGVPVRSDDGKVIGFRGGSRDITGRKREQEEQVRLENDLQQARKMEAVGTLAAGIAHEINTPIQFVGDNAYFLNTAVRDLLAAIGDFNAFIAENPEADAKKLLEHWDTVKDRIDFDYLLSEIPQAQGQLKEGLLRVNKIVGAMKEFSHMSSDEKVLSDINRAVESTVTVCRNTWKYVADMEIDLQMDLPMVQCFISDIKQVVMNLIINAAHAISDVVDAGGGADKGRIRISTRGDAQSVVISVGDSGTGIPEEAQTKIFDPFFTTKEVGKGTGQGLSIAYRVIEKHNGRIWFETEVGLGTTFFIELPLE